MFRGREEANYGRPCNSIMIGCDHSALTLKKELVAYIKKKYSHIDIIDVGTHTEERCDFPDIAAAVARPVQADRQGTTRGIVLDGCGPASGIACNKFHGIRAAVVWDITSCSIAREHSDCNIISIGGKVLGSLLAQQIVDTFIDTKFVADSARVGRLDKIVDIEMSQGVYAARTSSSGRGGDFNSRAAQAASPYKLPL